MIFSCKINSVHVIQIQGVPCYNFYSLAPMLEEVIFSVASVCVCLFALCRLNCLPMDLTFGTHNKDHHISDEFDGQGHQGTKYKKSSFQPCLRKGGPRSTSRGSRS